MLHLISVASPHDQQAVLADFDPMKSCWLVSDLKSKLDLSRGLLAQREFVPGEAFLRASELWRILLGRLRPDLQVVTREFAITLIAQELSQSPLPQSKLLWTQSPGVANTAYQYLTQLMPILAHPQGAEILEEWFAANEPSSVRWKRWFDLSLSLWKTFLVNGFVAAQWVSGVLVNEVGFESVWDRDLIVDLGAELNQVEADLLVQLASHFSITVLKPNPSWQEEYKRTLFPYDLLERKIKVKKSSLSTDESSSDSLITYKKFTTMIAEVKDAVAQVREWTEAEGIPPYRIAIAAPDLEAYWPALSAHFREEGLPFQKDIVRRLHTFPDISHWLADLRLKSGAFSEADLEISLYETNKAERILSYDKFKVLFTTIYGREDLVRNDVIHKMYEQEVAEHDVVARDEFVAWTLKLLPENADVERAEILFRRFFAECPESLELELRRWLHYLQQVAARVECPVEYGDPEGVACINLTSAENSPATHMIILGLTESALKETSETAVLLSDILSLSKEYGFHLPSPDYSRLEFEARWVIESSKRCLLLCLPETDFSGNVQAASWLWVRGAREQGVYDQVSVPRITRWDELQRAPLSEIASERGWSQGHLALLENSIEQDLGFAPLPTFAKGLKPALSPSGLEDYLKCPFIFAAKRLFKLSDLPNLDLDVDAATRGSLMHALFEQLTAEPMRLDLADGELANLIDIARTQAEVQLADERLWVSLRTRYMELGRKFLSFEKEWRAQFPKTKTIGREVKVKGFIDATTGDLVADAKESHFEFRGFIDRVDADDKGALGLIDYKSSSGDLSQYSSWLENNRLQLLLYSLAIENGLSEMPKGSVLTAVYYVSRTMNRDYGFKVSDVEQGLYHTADRKKNKLTHQEKQKLYDGLRAKVKEVVSLIKDGAFAPKPADPQICTTCQWSLLCRAPHLNT